VPIRVITRRRFYLKFQNFGRGNLPVKIPAKLPASEPSVLDHGLAPIG
jgi:hypothetical protein